MALAAFIGIVLLASACYGLPQKDVQDRIVGGQDATPGMFPYAVSLRYPLKEHICGGVIITKRTILTAAHCFVGMDLTKMSVATGSVKLDSGDTRYRVARAISHPAYNETTIRNDIGLLIVDSDIAFNNFTQSIVMDREEMEDGHTVTLMGWGFDTYPVEEVPNNMQYLSMKSVPQADCVAKYADVHAVGDDELCAFLDSGKGACHHDSGSPGVHDGELVGILSYGVPCAAGYPDVFARVSSYVDWVDANKV